MGELGSALDVFQNGSMILVYISIVVYSYTGSKRIFCEYFNISSIQVL